jgi:hypothetical protein
MARCLRVGDKKALPRQLDKEGHYPISASLPAVPRARHIPVSGAGGLRPYWASTWSGCGPPHGSSRAGKEARSLDVPSTCAAQAYGHDLLPVPHCPPHVWPGGDGWPGRIWPCAGRVVRHRWAGVFDKQSSGWPPGGRWGCGPTGACHLRACLACVALHWLFHIHNGPYEL